MNPPHQVCDIACFLLLELSAGDYGDLLAHTVVSVEVTAQACVVLLHGDPGCLPQGLGVNMAHLGGSLVKEENLGYLLL